jgi:two-component system sensor histidine kinase KdpD
VSAPRPSRWIPVAIALAAVAAATFAARAVGANATTTALGLLLVVQFLALRHGLVAGLAASLAGTLAFNYFFLDPLHTFTIAEPANWVALAVFGITSWITSRLVAAERHRAEEAEAKRREIELLYDLCFSLFTSTNAPGRIDEAAARTARALGSADAALFFGGGGNSRQAWPETPLGDPRLRREIDRAIAGGAAHPFRVDDAPRSTWIAPLEVGGRTSGALLLFGATANEALLASAARLLALAVERDRLIEEAARGAAAAESDRLKTALLRAVSHDLRSPLTAMGIGLEALLRDLPDGADRERLREVARERERLGRRIDQLLAAARLEAGLWKPHPEPMPPAELFRSAREHLALVLAGREVRTAVAPDCPEVRVDAALAVEALVNLLENAGRAAPAGTPLDLAANVCADGRVALEVLDRGPGFPEGLLAGRAVEGGRSGLGLAIVRQLVAASGGELVLAARPGGGAIARLVLPAFATEAVESGVGS